MLSNQISHTLAAFGSPQKKGLLLTSFQSKFSRSILFGPNWITLALIFIDFFNLFSNTLNAIAPAATLTAVSLALDLPPPL